jgi:succinate dehydrogenase / fumarate reductase, iron-sulfur subunit
MSFLEMLDMLNERLIQQKQRPVEFDHDCREGICGQCGVMINGRAHGPLPNTTTCQLHMRTFKEGDTVYIEPFRATAFPVKCDLKVDRSAFDREACQVECPQQISVLHIARMNWEYNRALLSTA